MFRAVDLSRMTLEDLTHRPQAIKDWPTTMVDVETQRWSTCIATWRRDVSSDKENSNRLSACAWDALKLGFSYMLCDIVSLPQDSPDISLKVIEFSQLYESLHAVISYDVDPDLQRCWLRHEAINLLQSPTSLRYIAARWRLRIPLIFSLILRQVCTRRLGLQDVNTDHLHLCDTEAAIGMTLRDLDLLRTRRNIRTIALDRRDQTFASDVILIYELSQPDRRPSLVEKLEPMKTNSIVAPALAVIWAMVEGLTVSIRGCDWNIDSVLQLIRSTLRSVGDELSNSFTLDESEDRMVLSMHGRIQGQLQFDVEAHNEYFGDNSLGDLIVRCRDSPASADHPSMLVSLLNSCCAYLKDHLSTAGPIEPAPLTGYEPQYRTLFDDETPGHN